MSQKDKVDFGALVASLPEAAASEDPIKFARAMRTIKAEIEDNPSLYNDELQAVLAGFASPDYDVRTALAAVGTIGYVGNTFPAHQAATQSVFANVIANEDLDAGVRKLAVNFAGSLALKYADEAELAFETLSDLVGNDAYADPALRVRAVEEIALTVIKRPGMADASLLKDFQQVASSAKDETLKSTASRGVVRVQNALGKSAPA